LAAKREPGSKVAKAKAKANKTPRRRTRQTSKRQASSSRGPALGRKIGRRLLWLLSGPLGFVLLVVGLAWYVSLDVDDLRRPPQGAQPSITLLDREGARLATYGNIYGEHVTLNQVSPWLPKAVVAIEDRRFWQHPGFDPIGIMRALVENVQAGRVVQGGSTISQQLAKLAFLSHERTLSRKVKEALYTLWLEARLNKEEILEAYLNRIYLGSGAYGVDAAARQYFDRPASELALAEAAMLAGLIKAPSYYAPTRDLERARQRAAVVLDAMVEAGVIDRGQAAAAKAAPASLAAPHTRADIGYFADWIAAETRLLAGAEHRRLVVETTLDRAVQRAAERAVQQVMARYGEARNAGQAALVAMTPDGRIRAMLGGRSYADSQFNRATRAERQPGSAFKLFVYLAALERGLLPSDAISGAPVEIDGWTPGNFEHGYPERITLADAFAESVNTAAVRLAERIGRERVIEMAERLGVTSELRPHPSLALGTSEVSLLELTGAYATVANGGRLAWPQGIRSIESADGKVLYHRRPVDDPVLEPAVVRAMTAMLETTLSRGTGRQGDLRRFAAGKTGTSADHRDAWFVGFTDEVVAGVWVGNDDGTPMRGVTGGGLPARIFHAFVVDAYGDEPFQPLPAPSRPPQGPYPAVAVRDVIGDVVDGAVQALKRLFGG